MAAVSAGAIPAGHARAAVQVARAAVRGTRLRSPLALHRRHPGGRRGDPASVTICRKDAYYRRSVPSAQRDGDRASRHPAKLRGRAAAYILEALSNGPTLAFKDMAMQLLGNLFEYELGATRRGTEHPGCDLRRHRQRCRIRDERQEGRAGLHDLAAWPHEPVPAGADVQPAGRQHPQPRDRRRVRRLPGHRQGGVERPRVQAQVQDRHGQLDQLGAADGAGGVLLCRLLPGDDRATTEEGELHRAVGQLRQHLRRPCGAHDGPAHRQARARHQRERRAGRVLPHRRLSGARQRRHLRDLEPVDGHFQGQQLRAFRIRPAGPRCGHGQAPVRRGARERTAAST